MTTPFKPTVLLVMQHKVTGKKYFCKSTLLDRLKWYKGSGTAWNQHLKEHGKDITVGVLGFYVDEQRCLQAAKEFSISNNIVDDDSWANLITETGKNNTIMAGEKNPFYGKTHSLETREKMRLQRIGKSVNKGAYRSAENRAKISASLKGRKNLAVSIALTGRKLSDATKAKISEAGKKRIISNETKEKIRQAALAQWARYRESKKIVIC